MSFSVPPVFREPTIRISMIAIFMFGFAGAAIAPYQSIIGIRELGLSNALYSSLIFAAAAVNVTVSIVMGNLADRIGEYRSMMLVAIVFGIIGFSAVYVFPNEATFIASGLFFLPVYWSLNSLLFANVRAASNRMAGHDAAAVNSGVRAMISLSWVLVPGAVAFVLSNSKSMLPAYLLAALACVGCLVLVGVFLPRQQRTDQAATHHLSHLAALGEVLSLRVFIRLIALALVTCMLHINGAVLPLIVTGAAGGKVTDVGVLIGLVAFLEVVFIIVWGRIQRRMKPLTALIIGGLLYVVYLGLLGFASAPWHVYALSLISGAGAAALISIPITYLQDLISERPGLGSALISVNLFLSGGLSALLFALGTFVSSYSGTALFGSAAGILGLGMLFVLDGKGRRLLR